MPCVAELVSKSLSTPIIFIGAHCTQALARRVIEVGAIGFLLKPFKAESLIEYLEKALKSKSAE
jgi:FixJ family two-component response regulator